MNSYTDKAARKTEKPEKSQSTFQLQDNRPGSLQQKKLADALANKGDAGSIQKKLNSTGLPDQLKSGIENLSGHSMDDVKVHYNSSQPAQLNAHAYAQGTDIHIASGQEKHLPHEAWHVVQQKQGRVKPTMQLKEKVNVNDDEGLEKEADVMGVKALQMRNDQQNTPESVNGQQRLVYGTVAQRSQKVTQLILINKDTVSAEVLEVYKGLGPEAKTLLRLNETFHEFFDLSAPEQIDFLHALNSSTTVVNTLLQSHSRAIMGSDKDLEQQPPLQELQFNFLKINPNFLENLLAVTQGHAGIFHFSETESLTISSFSSIRSLGPAKALSAPESQALVKVPVKKSQISIHSVMEMKTLSDFLGAQHLFQKFMRSMDDLKSIGYEFEFASFTGEDGIYQEDEIIPSHQLMAKSEVGGNFFGLSWRLESDSKNTLELVSPPFVFSRDELGTQKSQVVKRELETEAGKIALSMDQKKGTLPQTTAALATNSIGYGWQVDPKYENFHIVTNKKSGGNVYSQQNVSMYPHEIGQLLEDKFKNEDLHGEPSKLPVVATNPTNVARLVRSSLTAGLPEDSASTDSVKQAIAVFSRYASNVLAIPSFRHRQVTGVRKDNMATEVKETLGVWVKTDPLNVLKHLLKAPADMDAFHFALGAKQHDILAVFRNAGAKFIDDATPLPQADPSIDEIRERILQLKGANSPLVGLALMNAAKQQLIAERPPQPIDFSPQVRQYVVLMLQDLNAFIQRALQVDQHEEADPKSTTSEFLSEEFGTGEGVRKGTFIKGVPTSQGPMYVTEIR